LGGQGDLEANFCITLNKLSLAPRERAGVREAPGTENLSQQEPSARYWNATKKMNEKRERKKGIPIKDSLFHNGRMTFDAVTEPEC
jgi:hypothetical protein